MKTIEEIEARGAEIDSELAALQGKGDWSPEDQSRHKTLKAEIDELIVDRKRAHLRQVAQNPDAREAGSTQPVGDRRVARPYDDARRTIDTAVRSGLLPDHGAQAATELLENGSSRQRTTAARWATTTGDPAYLEAFAKLLADPTRGHMLWSPAEQAAYRAVEEFRAASLSDSAGGYMVPFTLDPAILLTNAGSVDPMRQISRVVRTTTDTWNGVSSAGVTAEWLAEATEAADATPTLVQPSIAVHKGAAFVPFSYEVGMDAVNFSNEITRLLVDGADTLQATAYITGTGSGQPYGIVTALDDGASETSPVTPETFASADIYALQNALPPRHQPRARWLAQLSTINKVAQFETANGALLFPGVQNDSPTLLRKPLHEASKMRAYSAIDAAATAENQILIYGDFSNYVIVDRIGTTVELIPNLVGASHRPTGQRGLFLWFRTGADSVNDDAFRMLDIDTAA